MATRFMDAVAESLEEFLDLTRHAFATYYEVYRGTPDRNLERIVEAAAGEGDLLLRFDMRAHSEAACLRFCRLDDFRRRVYEIPPGVTEMPLPYFRSYVRPFGFVTVAWTRAGVEEMIASTSKEREIARRVTGFPERGNRSREDGEQA